MLSTKIRNIVCHFMLNKLTIRWSFCSIYYFYSHYSGLVLFGAPVILIKTHLGSPAICCRKNKFSSSNQCSFPLVLFLVARFSLYTLVCCFILIFFCFFPLIHAHLRITIRRRNYNLQHKTSAYVPSLVTKSNLTSSFVPISFSK
ncbi:hypothetical protein BD408DRAFT_45817 [Parasitella parasitica]|nr:hypothetical protein BD408DRAFT_45817 [Parasitella parasitica]